MATNSCNIFNMDKVTATIIAIVAALAVLGVIVVTVTIAPQQAEAGCVTGYFHSVNKSALFTAFEKSEGRCFSR